MFIFGFKGHSMPDNIFCIFCVCVDGASDPDAEPDEGEADGDADCLVQRVSQILWHFLCSGHSGTHCRVSFVTTRRGCLTGILFFKMR